MRESRRRDDRQDRSAERDARPAHPEEPEIEDGACGPSPAGAADVVDLHAVHADDAFLDALATGLRPSATEDLLAAGLAAWANDSAVDPSELWDGRGVLDNGRSADPGSKDDPCPVVALRAFGHEHVAEWDGVIGTIRAAGRIGATAGSAHGSAPGRSHEPDTLVPDVPVAVSAVDVTAVTAAVAAPRPKARRTRPAPRFGNRLAAAAAVAAVLLSAGLLTGGAEARPGDPLFPVTKVLFSERAHSLEQAEEVRTHLEQARQALRDGRHEEAARELTEAAVHLGSVGIVADYEELAGQKWALAGELAAVAPETVTAAGSRDAGRNSTPAADPSQSPPAQAASSPSAGSGGTASSSRTARGSTTSST
ncbi:MAG: hypothetical protein AB7J32_03015, partial [Pseudonocardia sp.]